MLISELKVVLNNAVDIQVDTSYLTDIVVAAGVGLLMSIDVGRLGLCGVRNVIEFQTPVCASNRRLTYGK